MKVLLQIQVDNSGNLFFHSDYDFPDVLKRRPPVDWEDGIYKELAYSILHNGANIRRAVKFVSLAGDDPRADYIGLHPALEEALTAWRREKAREKGVPAYQILHQRVLLAIADDAPEGEWDLLNIAGFGPAMLNRYGNEILELVKNNVPESELPY